MTGCNCSPMPLYVADYIENLNKWVEMNHNLITWYVSWYNIWAQTVQNLEKQNG